MLTGFTLAAGIAMWGASATKCQADTDFLHAFMFLWNMLGVLILLPAWRTTYCAAVSIVVPLASKRSQPETPRCAVWGP